MSAVLRAIHDSPVERARRLAAAFAERAAEHDRDASFPFENFDRLFDAGLLTLALPRDLGGAGAAVSELAQVIAAIGSGEPATALVLVMQYMQHRGFVRPAPAAGWPPHLAQRLARDALERVSLTNALRVEPELGSPARGGLPATTARRTAEGWRLSGRKIYSTGAPILRWYLVWARTDDDAPRVGALLVPAGAPGIQIEPTWDHLGLRASGSHDVVFEDVPVPFDHAIDLRAPEAWAAPDAAQSAEMTLLLGSLYDGIARSAAAWLARFLRERVPASLGRPLAELPRFQEAVGAIEARLLNNRRLLDSLARDIDAGAPPPGSDSGLIKLIVTGNAIAAVEAAVELSSNHGLSRRNPLERHLRDVLCARVHTPQDDSVKLATGRRALAAA